MSAGRFARRHEAREAADTGYAPIGPVDIAIITVLPEEYAAVHACLPEPRQVTPTHENANSHAWVRSAIPALGRSSSFEVVLARGLKGPGDAHNATTATIDAFQPEYVLLVGIAGGLGADLDLGDVVVSSRVYGYEYGKVDGGFYPRPDYNYPTDPGIVALADSMQINHPRWMDFVKPKRPDGRRDRRPTVTVGPVASGNKVVDDISDPAFAPVLQGWPDLVAVEMESLGSMQAVEGVRQRRQHWVQFSTIRGISDIPRDKHPRDGGEPTPSAGPPRPNPEREAWKLYAAGTAAAFTVQAIRCAWPRPPKPRPADVE